MYMLLLYFLCPSTLLRDANILLRLEPFSLGIKVPRLRDARANILGHTLLFCVPSALLRDARFLSLSLSHTMAAGHMILEGPYVYGRSSSFVGIKGSIPLCVPWRHG